MEPVRIDDPDDPRVDDYRALKGREPRTHLVAESRAVVERLAGSPCRVRSVLVTPQRLVDLHDVIGALDAPILVAERAVIERIAGYDVHRGVLASIERPAFANLPTILERSRRIVVLEGCNDLENIGAIARSARALGVDALVLDPTCADPFTRRSLRVSMGELLRLPVARCSRWPDDLALVDAAGFETWALTPSPAAASLVGILRGEPVAARVALLAGAEGPGLRASTLERARRHVRIPMHHDVDSLNLGHALAIAIAAVSPVPDLEP